MKLFRLTMVVLVFTMITLTGCATQKDSIPNDTTSKIENTNGNLVNMGIAAQEGDWIYYVDGDFITEDFGLYKVRADGSQTTKISDDDAFNINVVGEWIYYINYTYDGYYIYKIRTNGQDRIRVSDDMIQGWPENTISVVDDWIYYSIYEDGIYKIRTDGSDRTKLSNEEGTMSINVVEDWIYYVSYRVNEQPHVLADIYKIRTDGSDRTRVSDDYTFKINVVDDWIYYIAALDDYLSEHYLYKVRTDGSERTKVSEDILWGMGMFNPVIVVGDWIYYSFFHHVEGDCPDSQAVGGIYKMRTDGSSRIKIGDYEAVTINVVGDWIYYFKGTGSYRVRTDGTDHQSLRGDNA